MLEWLDVKEEFFLNPNGVKTSVKIIYPFKKSKNFYLVDCKNRDLDLIAFEEMGSEAEVLNIIQNNCENLMDYDFDLSKIEKIYIPVE